MSTRRLLLDAGNTRLKWAVVEGGVWTGLGHAHYSDLSALTQVLANGMSCFIASVAAQQHEDQIRALLAQFAITPTWLKTEAGFRDVQNGYDHPQQLGVDRWMGLIATRKRSQNTTLVVSAGTALTVDALSTEGRFLGGLIVPGLDLMRQSLGQGTAQVAEAAGQWQAFPRSTADAVQSGAVAALCGAIQQQHARLAHLSGDTPHCILTGGAAESVLPHLSLSAELVPALVLEGIECVANKDDHS